MLPFLFWVNADFLCTFARHSPTTNFPNKQYLAPPSKTLKILKLLLFWKKVRTLTKINIRLPGSTAYQFWLYSSLESAQTNLEEIISMNKETTRESWLWHLTVAYPIRLLLKIYKHGDISVSMWSLTGLLCKLYIHGKLVWTKVHMNLIFNFIFF